MFFSLFLVFPVLGAFMGPFVVAGLLFSWKVLRYAIFGQLFMTSTGLPTLCASWCWMRGTWRFVSSVLVPAVCFLLFVMHPSVGHAYWYGMYWFIPIVLYMVQGNVYCTALQSTFVAHAVGSVVWCYLVPTTPEMWMSLIPVVAVERCMMACGMVIIYYVIRYMKRYRSFDAAYSYDYGRQ